MDIITYALAKKMTGDQAQETKAEIQEIKVDIEAIREDLKDNVEATEIVKVVLE